jgi:hypothetical protein
MELLPVTISVSPGTVPFGSIRESKTTGITSYFGEFASEVSVKDRLKER